jgi:hypothetical protein
LNERLALISSHQTTGVIVGVGAGVCAAVAALISFAAGGRHAPNWFKDEVRSIVRRTGVDQVKNKNTEPNISNKVSPILPTNIGIHLSDPGSTESFANLAMGSSLTLVNPGERGVPVSKDNLDENGNIKLLPSGAVAVRYLIPSSGADGTTTIRCTYSGRANVEVAGPSVTGVYNKPHDLLVKWEASKSAASLNIRAMDAKDPVRNVDCRDVNTPLSARFAPRFLDLIKGFKVLRFMDWQNTNNDRPVTWSSRHTEHSLAINEADGVSLEDMVSLAELNNSDAWFNMPSRSDDDYIRNFAQYVHDHLSPRHKVYVELSNEVWNWSFPVSRHVMQDGLDARLGNNAKEAISFQYAKQLIHVMDIWAAVFKDNPSRLIRVAAGQHSETYRSNLILGYRDLPKHVDAFATAPYFGYDTTGNPDDLAEIFRRIHVGIESTLRDASVEKGIAAKYGLRFIAYESGQGIVLADVPLNERIQRDQRMYDAYRTYLDGWRKRVGDTIIIFGTVFRTRESGAWGLLEFEGQSAAQAPKYRAVRDELER